MKKKNLQQYSIKHFRKEHNHLRVEEISTPFLLQEYEKISQHFAEDDRECLTLMGRLNYLAHQIPLQCENLFQFYGKCFERMNLHNHAFRCYMIQSHLFPKSVNAIQSLQHCLIEGTIQSMENPRRMMNNHGSKTTLRHQDSSSANASSSVGTMRKINLEENKAIKELQLRQLMIQPLDFELRLFFVKKLIDSYLLNRNHQKRNKMAHEIYLFVLDYFDKKYISKIIELKVNHSVLSMEQVQEFKIMIELFQQNKLEKYAIELNRLVLKLCPTSDPQLYLSLFDLYIKTGKEYLKAFKMYSHYMYLTGNNSIENYAICGECLEKAEHYHLALLAFWQCHSQQQQELMSYHQAQQQQHREQQQQTNEESSIVEEIKIAEFTNGTNSQIAQYDHQSLKYLRHILMEIIPKLNDSSIVLTKEQQDLVLHIQQHANKIDFNGSRLFSNK
ncbi:hypothetical protein C9374_012526 [Naegleria lovaniensis]|uniref:Uncharacterized protein n=1 Tax=Naegleria lovaniensis TaxID=51637 RepID=A0AA88KR08_NAELO|nr:uncharacterized protein C9374_012526 [Naegleria lovaniensis]KAG2392274.1 hypothetical protein C9374_012526 [Naegleria lovaniensis]